MKTKYKPRTEEDDHLAGYNPDIEDYDNKDSTKLALIFMFVLGAVITLIIFQIVGAGSYYQENKAKILNETINNATTNGYNQAIYNSLIRNSLFLSGKQDLPYFIMMENGNLSVNYVSKEELCK